MSEVLQPLERLPAETRGRIAVVLCDIDDTLTTDGRLLAVSYSALERLHQAGLLVLPITGRPAGWCDHIARMWPVSGIVGENLTDSVAADYGRAFGTFLKDSAVGEQGGKLSVCIGRDSRTSGPMFASSPSEASTST